MLRSKKGFTIVELVIVIAVIAILAAVLIPTFGSVIEKANESTALQKSQNALQLVTMGMDGDMKEIFCFTVDGFTFKYVGTSASGAAESLTKVTSDSDADVAKATKTLSSEKLTQLGVTVKTSATAVPTGSDLTLS